MDPFAETVQQQGKPRYVCPHPNCSKSFTRQEHLSRHKLNHWPKEIFRCHYVYPEDGVACNRTFVRRDLLVRHEKRHSRSGSRLQHRRGSALSADGDGDGNAEDVSSGSLPPGDVPVSVQDDSSRLDHIVLDTSDKRIKSNSNVNQFFSWLFDDDQQQQQHYAQAQAQSTAAEAAALPAPSYTNKTNEQQQQQQQPLQSSGLSHPTMANAQQPDVAVSEIPKNPPLLSRQPMPLPNVQIKPSSNVMEDIFSIDFLSNDPLQALVQELSAPNENVPKASPSICSSSSRVTSLPKSSPKFNDERRSSVKDNYPVQKSKIGELKSQVLSDSHPHSANTFPKHMLKKTPSFFFSDPQTKSGISPPKLQELYELVPVLKPILVFELENYLKSYWLNFHPQYPILHKPSFNIESQPAILLLSMIMTGASYLGAANRKRTSDAICGPLRWIIFSHEDFQPPSETYIIQSLLLLECYEKTSTNRYLHERSYLHHGTTIQLLRRTPSLGGHPLRFKTEQQPSSNDPEEVYHKWIEFETLKRTALYAFYIDTTHAVVFGYTNLFINYNQVQLALPCSDEIWESYDLSYERLLENGFGERSTSFLDGLKRLMNNVFYCMQGLKPGPFSLSTSKFGQKILLAGIISIMFQLQQQQDGNNGIFNMFKKGKKTEQEEISWEEIVSFAIDYWYHDIMKGCHNPSNSILSSPQPSPEEEKSLRLLKMGDNFSCKIPAYHMAQIIVRIFQYDYYIYAGAPWRMNVKAEWEEYKLVSRRMLAFSRDPMNGGMALMYAYQFLFEMFYDGDNGTYDVNLDYCITRPNTLALTSLLIWSYNFSLYGSEADVWDNSEPLDCNETKNLLVKQNYVPKEGFHEYLKRMREFLKVDQCEDVIEYRNQIKSKAFLLEHIPNKHFLCGFMIFMRDLFDRSYWELGREFGKLFDNCLERSMGRQKITCEHMYEV